MISKEPPLYLQAYWDRHLEELFEERDRSAVLKWLRRHSGEGRVVLVGAGFTQNAQKPPHVEIPLWSTQTEEIRTALGISDGDSFGPLELPDIYEMKHERGKSEHDLPHLLRDLLPDESLSPGKAHDALWASEPRGVITTNYLDTTLEKSQPRRFRKIVEDADLGPGWGDEGLCPLIYFHGHRESPDSWVVGRRQYETIEQDKPILTAKVRQLIAEYPVLIVGYSLTDPDFHAIYRSTVEAMQYENPGALALMRQETGILQPAQELTKEYWEKNNLSVVTFTSSAWKHPDEAHEKFLNLTLKVETYEQFRGTFQRSRSREVRADSLNQNIEIALSALDFQRGDEPDFVASDDSKTTCWQEALEALFSPEEIQSAILEEQKGNNSDSARRKEAVGELVTAEELRQPQIPVEHWLRGSSRWKKKAELLVPFLDLGARVTHLLSVLLEDDATRPHVRRWLQKGLELDVHQSSSDEKSLLAALGILSDGDIEKEIEWASMCTGHEELPLAVGTQMPPKKTRSKRSRTTRLLHQARKALLSGEKEDARKRYTESLNALQTSPADSFESLIQGYFSAQGVFECLSQLSWDDSHRETLEQKAAYASRNKVARWLDRVEALAQSTRKQALKSREKQGYEATGGSWSATPGSLHRELEFAEELGCPPGWIREKLLEPLLGLIPDAAEELRLRQRYGTKDSGKWALRAVEKAEFSVNRASFFERPRSLGRAERLEGQRKVSRAFVGEKVGPEALNNLKQAAQTLLVRDVEKAVATATRTPMSWIHDSARLEALSAISHVCAWEVIRDPLRDEIVRKQETSRDSFDVNRTITMLPWEHWIRCDDFLKSGGRALLTCIVDSQLPDQIFANNVGWVLDRLRRLSPESSHIERLAKTWLQRRARKRTGKADHLNAALALASQFGKRTPGQTSLLSTLQDRHERLAKVDLQALVLAAKCHPKSDLHKWGTERLVSWAEIKGWTKRQTSRSLGHSDEVDEARALGLVMQRHPQLAPGCAKRLLELIDETWWVLPQLSDVLEPRFWKTQWPSLLKILAVGGRKRDPHTWQLARLALLRGVTFDEFPITRTLHPDCEFLLRAAVDGLAHSESSVANSSIYAIAAAARHSNSEETELMIQLALEAASEDIRISVVHGAAFIAGFWSEQTLASAVLQDCARKLTKSLSKDPAAAVRRQFDFGTAKGRLGK